MVRWLSPLALVATACASTPVVSAIPLERCENQWCATVRVEDAGVIDVALIVPPNATSTNHVDLAFTEGLLGAGFTKAHVRLVDPAGIESPWPSTFRVSKSPKEIRYRVRLPDDSRHPLERLRELSFRHGAGWHLKGYSFLPDVVGRTADAPPAILRFALNDHKRVLGSVLHTEHTFHGRGLSDLVRATYEVGRPHHHCHRTDERMVCVASSTEVALEQTTEFVADALRHTAALLGPLDAQSVLISVHPADTHRPVGLAVGSGVLVLTGAPPEKTSRTSFALVHEIVHLWNPGKRRIPALWLREGLTEYLAHQVIARMSKAGEHEFIGRIQEAHRRHRAAGSTLENAHGDDIYAAGVMAGYCLDRLLERSGSSTAELVRRLLDQVPANDATPLTDDWFFAELAKASPSSAGYFRLMLAERSFDFSNCGAAL